MCCLALGPVSTTSSSQLMCGFSTVNVEPSFLVTMSPAARYSAVRVLMVASRMSSTGALDSFFLPFVVISLPIRVSPSSKVWRQAPSTCLWETAVRLLLGHRTDDDGGSEILLVLQSYSNGSLSNRSPTLPARGPNDCLRSRTAGSSIPTHYTPPEVYCDGNV